MKKDLLEKGAIVQRDQETYAIAPHIPGGITSPATLLSHSNRSLLISSGRMATAVQPIR